jgi:hypothetical protein
MDKVAYNEGFVAVPTGTEYRDRMEALQNALVLIEAERDAALSLLVEVTEVDDADDLEEVLSVIREFVENDPFSVPY